MKDTGSKISSMVQARRSGPTEVDIRVTINKAKSMGKEHIHGLMALYTMAIGMKTELRATVLTSGSMDESISDHGLITTCMATDHTCGKTVVDMKASTSLIKNMAMVSMSGPMAANMKAIGATESSTVKENMSWLMGKSVSAYGTMANVSNG